MARAANKTALITGGARGLPLAIAEALAREGFAVAMCGPREPEEAASALAALKSLGAETAYFQSDIVRADGRFRLIQAVRQRFGRLDLLLIRAQEAIAEDRDALELGEEAFDAALHNEAVGPFFLAQAAALWMIEQRQADPGFEGGIVFLNARPLGDAVRQVPFRAARAALSAAAALLAARMANSGVFVAEIPAPETETEAPGAEINGARRPPRLASDRAAEAVGDMIRRVLGAKTAVLPDGTAKREVANVQ